MVRVPRRVFGLRYSIVRGALVPRVVRSGTKEGDRWVPGALVRAAGDDPRREHPLCPGTGRFHRTRGTVVVPEIEGRPAQERQRLERQ
jgi:hypothetical protein